MFCKRTLVAACFAVLVAPCLWVPAQAQSFKVIHSFTGGADGGNPWEGLTMDSSGRFYGTTNTGGGSGYGTVYQLKHESSRWVVRTLHSFAGAPNDGSGPYAGVVIGANGSLIGSTGTGGDGLCQFEPVQRGMGCGTIFELRNSKSGWRETVLYSFQGGPGDQGGSSDGGEPSGALALDSAGNIYGTTAFGGSVAGCFDYCGIVFKLAHSAHGWSESVLHDFGSGNDGGAPYGGVVMDKAGNLYGPTVLTGNNGAGPPPTGTIFQLVPTAGNWTESVLYSFQNGADGANPVAGLIFDQTGNLYSASVNGGPDGGGVAFELSPSSGNWNFSELYDFTKTGNSTPYECTNCYGPVGRLLMDSSGNLYGTAYATGAYGYGSVFKLSPSAGGWTYTSLHDFTGGTDGSNPRATLVFDGKGNLYGTAVYGGGTGCGGTGVPTGCGVVFMIVP